MADFFYETRAGAILAETEDPVQHADEQAAIAEGLKCLGEMAKDGIPRGERDLSVTIRNAKRELIYDAKLVLTVWSDR